MTIVGCPVMAGMAVLVMMGIMVEGQQMNHGGHVNNRNNLPQPCESMIYCQGTLLHTVQMAGVFNDSKHFVDMTLKWSPSDTIEEFLTFMDHTNNKPSKAQIRSFVDDNFNEPGTEFVNWTPQDWVPNPSFLEAVQDSDLSTWGAKLNNLWKVLGRKINSTVQKNPEKYSLIYVSNPFIVPGGRFREFYYWDSYWTIDGLLLSGMKTTVLGMLKNFIQMVIKYGFVPNGGRIYYTRRSQPPYLIPMVKLYIDLTNDTDFLLENVDYLKEEFRFWQTSRSTTVKDRNGRTHVVAQYNVQVAGPRPESYREDFESAKSLKTEKEKEKVYVELKSGAESGWDYSTRWFGRSKAKGSRTLKDLNVTSIAPVDLNSLLCMNARILSDFYTKLNRSVDAQKFRLIADAKNKTMNDLFWDNDDGIWYDVDVNTGKKRKLFYLSNVHPLWSGCYGDGTSREDAIGKALKYLRYNHVLNFNGGVPTSLDSSTTEQWDFPNAWAPLQHMLIMGLHNARHYNSEVKDVARSLAQKWIATNWKGYEQTGSMYEKYNVEIQGVAGGGGEYDVVAGFGWTNGVAIRFLNTFGDNLVSSAIVTTPKLLMILLFNIISLSYLQTMSSF